MPTSVEQLEAAVLVMLGCVPPPSPTAQREADLWLLAFAETDEAWSLFPAALARCAQRQAQYWLANGIYSKILTGWVRLSELQQAAFLEQLWTIFQTGCTTYDGKTTVRRLALALGTAALQSRSFGSVRAFTARVSSMADVLFAGAASAGTAAAGGAAGAAPGAPVTPASVASFGAIVELLRALAEQADAVALAGERRDRVMAEIKECAPVALRCLAGILGPSHGSPLSIDALWGAGVGGSLPPTALPATASALEGLTGWAHITSLTPGALFSAQPELWRAALAAALRLPDVAVRAAAVDALSCLMANAADGVLRDSRHDAALADLCTSLLRAHRLVRASATASSGASGNAADLAQPVARLFGSLLERETPWMAGRRSPPAPLDVLAGMEAKYLPHLLDTAPLPPVVAGGAPQPAIGGVHITLGAAALDLMLQFAETAPLAALEPLFEALPAVNAIMVADRHPFFAKPLYRALLGIICARVSYGSLLDDAARSAAGAAAGGAAAAGAAMPSAAALDEFAAFRGRSSVFIDPLDDCFSILGAREFVAVILNSLQAAHNNVLAAAGAAGDASAAAASTAVAALVTSISGSTAPGAPITAAVAMPPVALPPTVAALLQDAPAAVPLLRTWQPLEAALFCLSAVAEPLCEVLEEADLDKSNPDASAAEPALSLMLLLTHGAASPSTPPELKAAAARWIGSLARWVAWMARHHMDTPLGVAELFQRPGAAAAAGGAASGGAGAGAGAFGFGGSAGAAGSPGLDASISFVHGRDVFASILRFLLGSLHDMRVACRLSAAAARRPAAGAPPDTLDVLLGTVLDCGGLNPSSGIAGGGGAAGGAGGGDDDDAAEPSGSEAMAQVLVATEAAEALSNIARVSRGCAALTDLLTVKSIADAMQAASAAGLPALAYTTLLHSLLTVLSRLERGVSEAAAKYLLQPVLDGFAGMCAAIARGGAAAAAAFAAAPAAAQDLALARSMAIIVTAMRSPLAEDSGISDMPSPSPSPSSSPVNPASAAAAAASGGAGAGAAANPPGSPLDFLISSAWAAVEVLMPAVHARPLIVPAALVLVQQSIRVAARTVMPRLPAMVSLVAGLYERHLYTDCLVVVSTLITALPSEDDDDSGAAARAAAAGGAGGAGSVLSPPAAAYSHGSPGLFGGVLGLGLGDRSHLSGSVTPFVVQLMRRLSAATAAAAARPSAAGAGSAAVRASQLAGTPSLTDFPEAALEFLRLARKLLSVCPEAILNDDVLALLLPLLGFSLTLWDRLSARLAADVAEEVFTRPDLLRTFGGAISSAVTRHGERLVQSVVTVLSDDRGQAVFGSAADLLRLLFERFGSVGAGQAFLNAMTMLGEVDASDQLSKATSAARSAAGGGAAGEAAAAAALQAFSARKTDVPMDELSGASCLDAADRAAIAGMAVRLATSSRPRFRLLLKDLSALWRRAGAKDVLLSHVTDDAGATPDSEPHGAGGRHGRSISIVSPAGAIGGAGAAGGGAGAGDGGGSASRVGRALTFL